MQFWRCGNVAVDAKLDRQRRIDLGYHVQQHRGIGAKGRNDGDVVLQEIGHRVAEDREAILQWTTVLNKATQHLAEIMMNRSVKAALAGKNIEGL